MVDMCDNAIMPPSACSDATCDMWCAFGAIARVGGVVVMANMRVRAQASMTMRNSLALAKLPLAQNRLAEASTVAT